MLLAEQYVVNKGLPAPFQTRALALVAAAVSNATVAAWDSKYVFNRKHPSDLDPAVAPVVAVPQSPSYPSEHAAAAGAAAAVLAYLFPDQATNVANQANAAATSRVLAGVAFPSDVFGGLDLGQSIGQAVIVRSNGRIELDVHQVPFRQLPACGAVQLRSCPSPGPRGHGYSTLHMTSGPVRRPCSDLTRRTRNMRWSKT